MDHKNFRVIKLAQELISSKRIKNKQIVKNSINKIVAFLELKSTDFDLQFCIKELCRRNNLQY